MTSSSNPYAAPNRFEVDASGMRSLNSDRKPWDLLKELVQNAWDEAPVATVCRVDIERRRPLETFVVVEDDGPGFTNPSDSYTLLGDTRKRGDPKKRGRFNMGEKEIISVALDAVIETVGYTIEFPRIGGRAISPNDRKKGTRIELTMPWTSDETEPLIERLRMFRPTDCALVINGEEVPKRDPVATRECTLPTVIQSGPGEPMRHTRRKTEIRIFDAPPERRGYDDRTGEDTGGWIYEMGIPIQPISAIYDIDVAQKVPMPPNRTTVRESYLKDIYAETLNAMSSRMTDDQFAETWARAAIENERRIEEGAARRYFNGKYGANALLTSSDADSNMRAAEAGRVIVNPRSMSERERAQARRVGMRTTHAEFGRTAPTPDMMNPVVMDEAKNEFAKWVKGLARRVGIPRASVSFVSVSNTGVAAMCTGNNRTDPILTFNVARLSEDFFRDRGREQYELVIHELAHAWQERRMEHGPSWGHACCEVAARLIAPE